MEIKIGETIKNLRKERGRTQEQLASALGITFQAVSRWEAGLAYPDMELVPSIANYFGVSIDGLFGYNNDRQERVDNLLTKIEDMNKANNGIDVCIEDCIQLARNGLVEFPGNQALLLSLANLLYNAGYARYGEHHLTDAEGYDIFNVERHRQYGEWQEAITLYEKLVKELPDSRDKQQAISRLTQLYVATGETDKSIALIATLPDIEGAQDLLILNACDGKRRAEEYDKTLSKLLCVCANLMCSTVMMGKGHIPTTEAIRRVRNAIAILEMDHVDQALIKDDLTYHEKACMYLYLSVFLWRNGDSDGAFEALDNAYAAAKTHDRYARKEHNRNMATELPTYWPYLCVPDYSDVEKEIKADSRWTKWVEQCKVGC